MRAENKALLVIVLGLCAIVASFIYPRLVGGKNQWSDADAQEFTAAARQFHQESLRPQGQSPLGSSGDPSPEFLRAQDKFLQMQQRLEDAKSAGKGTAQGLFIAGFVLVLTGGFGFLATRSESD